MTPKELGELGHLEAARRSSMARISRRSRPTRRWSPASASRSHPSRIRRRRPTQPSPSAWSSTSSPSRSRIEGDGRAERIIVERTELDETEPLAAPAKPTRCRRADHLAIGYSTSPIEGVPYDDRGGKFLNEGGIVSATGFTAVGWARRGPTGTIGTNRPDGYEVAEQVAAAMPAGSSGDEAGAPGLKSLLGERGVMAHRL